MQETTNIRQPPAYSGVASAKERDLQKIINIRQPPAYSGVTSAWAWGENGNGQLGDGTTTSSSTPVQVQNLSAFRTIVGGGGYSLALKEDATVYAWGENSNGQLGDGTTTEHHTPVQVPNLGKVKAISAGMFHSLALKTDGTIWAWGWNAQGQLGDATTTDRHTPVQVRNLSGVKAISAGDNHSLALKTDGTVWAWGYNDYGQVGNGASTGETPNPMPVQVQELSQVKAIDAGGAHNLALKTDGTVWAWGSNLSGQLGNGASTGLTPNPTPVQVRGESPTSTQIGRLLLRLPLFSTALSLLFSAAFLPWNYLSDVQAISAGSFHSLALKTDGTARAWGSNWAGQLGDETTTERLMPVKVHSLSGVKAIATHLSHNLALKTAGSVWAWGFNDSGQVGDGTSGTFANRTAPVQVQNLSQVKAISTGQTHSLAKVSKTPGAEQ